jgi:hypothetical protein
MTSRKENIRPRMLVSCSGYRIPAVIHVCVMPAVGTLPAPAVLFCCHGSPRVQPSTHVASCLTAPDAIQPAAVLCFLIITTPRPHSIRQSYIQCTRARPRQVGQQPTSTKPTKSARGVPALAPQGCKLGAAAERTAAMHTPAAPSPTRELDRMLAASLAAGSSSGSFSGICQLKWQLD